MAAAVAALSVSAIASADNVQNDVVDSSGIVTASPGSSVAIGWRIQETGSDGVCSPATGAPTIVSVSPSGPVVASDSALTFTSCGSWQSVTFTVAADAAPGDYPVSVSASDADEAIGGDGSATIHVSAPPPLPDTTAPVVTAPGDQTLEATSPAGASQAFAGTAVDDVDGALSAPCQPTSYSLGSNLVACTATDAAGNSGSAQFTVTVQDTTPPVLSLPGSTGATATSADGAAVSFVATANDVVAGSVAVDCVPASGSTFPVAVTTVQCSATDGANTSSGSFPVTVSNSAPTITLPGQQTVEASGAMGSNVNFIPAPTGTDPQEGPLVPSCSHTSGSRFPLGSTTVTCTVTDSGGASATGTFDVVVHDTTPPVVIPPLDAVFVTGGLLSSADPRLTQFVDSAFALDLVGVVRFESNMPGFLPLGVSAITFTATDAAGNVGAASATIELRLPIPGQPQPPPPPPAAARIPPANVAGLRARSLDAAVQLEWRAAANASRYVVTRSDRAGASSVAYDGRATTFVDRGLTDGEEYRYVVVSYDAAGLRSVGVAVVAVPARPILSAPKHGAAVARPPLLTWRAVPGATYYNLQLLRISANGSGTKVLSQWPVKNRLQLARTWRYGGKTQRLSAGTYEWFVWAGSGSRAAENYSPLLGWSRFVVKAASR
ncbi:MAG: hypothetical protein QOI67_706 [Gaiellaceae bacterium]|jgi:hypothetical protein|nr:hypothetical protein [Gaiellaceae bacterium]